MPTIHVSAKVLESIFLSSCSTIAACTFLVYDWLLCLDQEIKFIWNWRSQRVTVASAVYVLSRYAFLIDGLLVIAAINPISDLSCRANAWTQAAIGTIGLIALMAFSALRAYALSNRSIWLMTVIIILALPAVVIRTVEEFYETIENLPSPLNCSGSSSISSTLALAGGITARGSQFLAEILVVCITWWYSYQSYRIQKGVKLGKSISSLLLHNGSIYFLFFATLYIVDIGFGTSSAHTIFRRDVLTVLERLIEPINSVFTCRFMLSLRQFDSTIHSVAYSGPDPQQRMAESTTLQFGAQPNDSLPSLIASFAYPVHVDSDLSQAETDVDATVEDGPEWREMDVVPPTLGMPSSRTHDQTPSSEPRV